MTHHLPLISNQKIINWDMIWQRNTRWFSIYTLVNGKFISNFTIYIISLMISVFFETDSSSGSTRASWSRPANTAQSNVHVRGRRTLLFSPKNAGGSFKDRFEMWRFQRLELFNWKCGWIINYSPSWNKIRSIDIKRNESDLFSRTFTNIGSFKTKMNF